MVDLGGIHAAMRAHNLLRLDVINAQLADIADQITVNQALPQDYQAALLWLWGNDRLMVD